MITRIKEAWNILSYNDRARLMALGFLACIAICFITILILLMVIL